MSTCDCAEHRRMLLAAAARLSRRDLLRGAVGVGAIAVLAGAVPSWATSRDASSANGRTWLAGDLHVHTVLSHDVWGGPDDDNTGIDESYTWGWTAGEQIAIAESRGLDFLALTDHNRTDALFLPDYRSDRLTLLPGYEHSLAGGHAGVFVADRSALHDVVRTDSGSTSFPGSSGLADFLSRVQDLDGLVVLNHPFYKRSGPTAPRTWTYDIDTSLGVDAVEVWNSVWFNRSEISPQISYDDPAALPWWEKEVLSRARAPMVGGSDNHWRILTAIAGVGQPTTWVHADGRRPHDVLAAIRAGRTTVSAKPPALGGARLEPAVIEQWPSGGQAGIGDSVAALGQLVVRTRVLGGAGMTLRLVSTGRLVASTTVTGVDTVVEQPVVLPERGWLRLELVATTPGSGMAALTSPVYAAGAAPAAARREPTSGAPVSYPLP